MKKTTRGVKKRMIDSSTYFLPVVRAQRRGLNSDSGHVVFTLGKGVVCDHRNIANYEAS